jgi:flagellar protein FlgJ
MDNAMQNIGDLAVAQAQTAGVTAFHGSAASLAAIDKKSKDFESMFMAQMLQPMFEGLGVDPTFGGGHGEEIMRSFLIQEYGKAMSLGGHLGIAESVKNAMIRSQEASMKNAPNASQGAAYAATR